MIAALAKAAAALAVIGAIALACVWLRADAAADRDRVWEVKSAYARLAAQAVLRERERQSDAVAAVASQAWAQELAAAQAATAELQAKLEARTRTVCYPKDIVKALNR